MEAVNMGRSFTPDYRTENVKKERGFRELERVGEEADWCLHRGLDHLLYRDEVTTSKP